MAAHSKQEVLAAIRRDGVVPVLSTGDGGVALETARHLVAGGLTTLELTNRGDGAVGVFEHVIAGVRKELPDLAFGMGSITDAATAAHVIALGADFVFAPTFSAEVARMCNGRNLPYVPGCGSVTEIQTAYEAGVDFVKIFPAGALGGPDFLSAVRGPCPWVEAIPSGGVERSAASIGSWFAAGAPAVGMGSHLFAGLIDLDWDRLDDDISEVCGAVASARRILLPPQ